MVIYIRELRAKAIREKTQFTKPADSMVAQSQLHAYKLDTWVGSLKRALTPRLPHAHFGSRHREARLPLPG